MVQSVLWLGYALSDRGQQGISVLYSLKPPSLLIKCYRDSDPRVKRPRREAYNSPSSSAKIKNSSSWTSTTSTFSWRAKWFYLFLLFSRRYLLHRPTWTYSTGTETIPSLLSVLPGFTFRRCLRCSPQTVEWKKQSPLWLAEGVLDTIYYEPHSGPALLAWRQHSCEFMHAQITV